MGDCCYVTPREWVRGNVVGAGAFGTVSLAMNKANGELFAVKSIESREDAKRALVALENEALILEELDCPWIVRCLGHDFTEENGVIMRNLFMEYMAGGSVADILKKFGGRLGESVIRTYTRGILQGLDYLHREGIVHCDIKGKNVLLGSSEVKLADFGSAKRTADDLIAHNEVVQWRGTPLWMAPEVVRQESQGKASDIWSLGCTVVEMATGSPPWSNISHPLVAMYRIGCSDELPELPQSLSPEGVDFLDKCLRRDSEQRWNSSQLLNHPFVTECFQVHDHQKHNGSQSPTSNLDFKQEWNSRNTLASSLLSQATPLLSLNTKMNTSKLETDQWIAQENIREKMLRPSPAQRNLHFLENGVSKIRPTPSTHGQWIVIKSSKHSPAMLDDAPFTDFISGSSAPTQDSHVKSESEYLKSRPNLQDFPLTEISVKHPSTIVESIEGESCVSDQFQPGNHGFSECLVCGKCWLVHSDMTSRDPPTGKLFLLRPFLIYDSLGNLWVHSRELIFHELKKTNLKIVSNSSKL